MRRAMNALVDKAERHLNLSEGQNMRQDEAASQAPAVTLTDRGSEVVLANGLVTLQISKPGGHINVVRYGGLDTVLQWRRPEGGRAYWDLVWSLTEHPEKFNFDVPSGEVYNVVHAGPDEVELSFRRPYVPGANPAACPLAIDKRYVLRRGVSGFYTYAIYERDAGWPGVAMGETRYTLKLLPDRFRYMALADDRQRYMPGAEDWGEGRSRTLGPRESTLFVNPVNPAFKGEVDDKYHYSCDNKDNRVHGWICDSPRIGCWVINASDEARNGGPTKQNLTSHCVGVSLSMFHSAHYSSEELTPKWQKDEAWKKVFGPTFVYLNQAPPGVDHLRYLWGDAKRQMLAEVAEWPYTFPRSPDFLKPHQRAPVVSGRLVVSDKYLSPGPLPGRFAFVGLATPGEKGTWQAESKGYQFWAQADADGAFAIRHVIPGRYDLFGWVPGVLGDFRWGGGPLQVAAGEAAHLGDVEFSPPRSGPTVWEIGVPDRTAKDFFVPPPDPRFVNRVNLNNYDHRFRQWGLGSRYSEMFPDGDLVYDVATSDWRRDWWWSHGVRVNKDGTYAPVTWEVRFHLDAVDSRGPYTFRMAIASSTCAAIQLRVNDRSRARPHMDTMQFGRDNALTRASCHGLHYEFTKEIPPSELRAGSNSLFLTQRKAPNLIVAVMYDYLRLEAPPGDAHLTP